MIKKYQPEDVIKNLKSKNIPPLTNMAICLEKYLKDAKTDFEKIAITNIFFQEIQKVIKNEKTIKS